MILCRVVGDVVAPVKNEHLARQKLLLCQPVDLEDRPKGASLIALDVAQAGEGDLVLVNKEGGGARIVFSDEAIPLQAVAVAVVDEAGFKPREWKGPPPGLAGPWSFDPPVRRVRAERG